MRMIKFKCVAGLILVLIAAGCGDSTKKSKAPPANSSNNSNSANSTNNVNNINNINNVNPENCGNGVLDPGESCDPAIAAGDGACPTSCTAPSCSTVTLVGMASACTARCETSPNACDAGGDGCCPTGCDSTTDSDCTNTCGNGVLEEPEICDGNCPASCDDGNVCTNDLLSGAPATCSAQCSNPVIAVCAGGDGCCPAGCTPSSDSDCEPTAVCGDGTVDPGETCDGDCPASCIDNNACTSDRRAGSADMCNVICEHRAITSCTNADGCCPTGCTFNNDSDCACTPSSCSSLQIECGPTDNGCGSLIDCGGCPSGEGCSQGTCVTQSTGNGDLGDPCVDGADCSSDPNNPLGIAQCLSYPNGYCSVVCIPLLFPCGGGALCVSDPANPMAGYCHETCNSTAECRSGYSCQTLSGGGKVCLPI